uniref:B30.2/SPRY domain-containing protein n=1 Tax=Sphaeramia orbicularis TaxID=375764 RepID=A0A673BB28_9TELE
MADQFRRKPQQEEDGSSSEQRAGNEPGNIYCHVCTETKVKAVKSCLVCLTSYCERHLHDHLTVSGLKRHQLIDPVENLEDRTCRNHDKPLELFCKTDQTCICMHCTYSDHKTHDIVPLVEEHKGQKEELRKTEAKLHQMIQDREVKIHEIKDSKDLSKKAAERERAEGIEVFTAVIESVQKSLNQLFEDIDEKQETTEKRAEDLIKELEQEVSELKKKRSEVQQLSCSEDHLHFVRKYPSVNCVPPIKTQEKVRVHAPSHDGSVARAVSKLKDKLMYEMEKLLGQAELKMVRRYAVDVTLDPDTAYPYLILSADQRQVHHGDVKKDLPENPQRFSMTPCILGKQSFYSGKFYFEVQVEGKTDWTLGVVRESIDRKIKITLSPPKGYWTIWLRNGDEYEACAGPPVALSLKAGPLKVGVFVDYEGGLVSFYDVDAPALIYSFTGCGFTEQIFPYFSPCTNKEGKNSAPLIISPVVHID